MNNISLKDDQQSIYFSNGCVELEFSKENGRWCSLREVSTDKIILSGGEHLSSVYLTYGGHTTVTSGRQQMWHVEDTCTAGMNLVLEEHHTETDENTDWLILNTKENDFRIQQYYGFVHGTDLLRRRVKISWEGDNEILLRKVDFRMPAVGDLEKVILEAPGYPFVLHQKLDSLPMGEWTMMPDMHDNDAPASRAGVLLFRHPGGNLLVWGFHRQIPSMMLVNRCDWGVLTVQRLYSACRMERGGVLEVGDQYLRLCAGEYMQALQGMQRFWDAAGIAVPDDYAGWARSARIYELHIGTTNFMKREEYEPYKNVGDLLRDLPRIADLGFNCIQIMPHFPFPAYSVHDYYDIDTHYGAGNEDEFKDLVRRAHELGLKVFLDVEVHGAMDKQLKEIAIYDRHPWLTEHPEWFLQNEYGQTAKTYAWSFDHSDQGYTDYLVDVFCYYTGVLDVDGFRIDAAIWNSFPNWRKGLGRPAYASYYANIDMFRQIRNAVHRIKPESVFYTEFSGPLNCCSYELTYNYDEHWMFEDLLPEKSSVEHFIIRRDKNWRINPRQMAEWLELRRLTYPRKFGRAHHCDSHDSFMWGLYGWFKRDIYGDEGGCLYLALSAFQDGALMVYTGAEKGSEDFYRRLFAVLEENKDILEGDCDYLAVQSSNEKVVPFLYRKEDEWLIPVLSFSDTAEKTMLNLDPVITDDEAVYTIYDVMSGNEISGSGREMRQLNVVLEPYAVQAWKLKH
jgi:glycosidase